jgi:murein DD-endopeptidase MepM/ murein hydrolase activator NlpD
MRKSILILLAIMLLATSSFVLASSEINNKQSELDKINQEIKALDKAIRDKQSSQKQVVNDINSLNDNIRNLSSEITGLDDDILDYEAKIASLEADLDETEIALEDRKETLYSRLRVMYKSKDVGYFEILFGAKDFEDLLTRMDMMKLLVEHDTDLIQRLDTDIKELELIKVDLSDNRQSLLSTRTQLDSKQVNLNSQVSVLGEKKTQLSKDLEALDSQVDSLNSDANQLTKLIEKMQLEAKYVGGEMAWPAPGIYRITSPFGYRIHPILNTKKLHTGIDIGAPQGTRIVAAQSGTIIYSDWYGGYGLVIMIDHGGGIVTLYGHNSKLVAKVGQKVEKGQQVSYSGTTGMSTGPHLHFEVRENGQYVDPLTYVTAQ